MAKKTEEAAKAARNIVVRLHSRHDRSPDQYEVLVEGRRVAYVGVGEKMPIIFLPGGSVKLTLTTEEKTEVAEFVRAEMAKFAAAAAAEEDRLAKLIAGGE